MCQSAWAAGLWPTGSDKKEKKFAAPLRTWKLKDPATVSMLYGAFRLEFRSVSSTAQQVALS